ncbi:MAG: SusC/RagA family TonB-linked outer membrane protein [Gemmatimonadaceae bacterium]
MAQAQTGTITGRVVAVGSSEPLVEARVTIVNTTSATNTNGDGRYTLRGVAPGQFVIRVLRVGYTEQKKSVTVAPGATVTLDFTLDAAVVKLQEIVTTATGEQRKVELGNTVAVIDAARRVEETPITSMNDLLVAKAPGLQVLPQNMTGSAAQIRIRGLNSASRSNAPIFIIDGVRVDGGTGFSTGGTSSSRLNDISPEEIENIEVIKGPSAATLYGTDAANGVIVITTKKGRPGNTRYVWSAEGGSVQDHNAYPFTWAEWGHLTTGNTAQIARCLNNTVADGTCKMDSVTNSHMVRDPRYSPIGVGKRSQYNGQISGGNDALHFFVSGNLENEFGPITMPSIDTHYLDSTLVSVRGEWKNPEAIQRSSFRLNMSGAFSPKLDMQVQASFVKSDQRLPQVDNNVNSFYYNAYTNPGHNYIVSGTNGLNYSGISSIGEPLHGWAQFTPADIFQRTQLEGVQRFIGSSTMAWRPIAWIQVDGTTGVDFEAVNTFTLQRLNEGPDFSTQRQGTIADNHNNGRIFTATLRSTGTWNPKIWANLRTTVGADYLNNEGDGSNANGTTLPPGGQTVGSATTKGASNTAPTATKTLGYYAQEQVALRDRLFLTAAVRYDQNTAFGTQYKGVPYPKVSASYNISDESFFPHTDLVNTMHLRLAYGASGVQPGATSALRTFATTTTSLVVDKTGLLASAIGNPNIKPETSAEWETGFDSKMLNNRVNVEFTYYSKQTRDALLNLNIAPSSGASAGSILKNLGSVKNAGAELSINTQVLDRRNFGWDLTISGSHNKNKLVTLGKDDTGKDLPRTGSTTRNQAGYPLNSIWAVPYTWSDADGNGLIGSKEVVVSSTDTTFMGPSINTDQLTIQNGFDLLKRKLRINILLDNKGGGVVFNQFNFLCTQTSTCAAKSDPKVPLWDQARSVAANVGTTVGGSTYKTNFGYYENGQFWRLREVSATYTLPDALVRKTLRAQRATFTLGARNLHVWTKYTGEDPESNYASGDVQATLLTTAPRRYITGRFNLNY